MTAAGKKCPSGGAEGQCTTLEANAVAPYSRNEGCDSVDGTLTSASASNHRRVRFRSEDGREWIYNGKRGLVLTLLASGRSITQWDCMPWHTRLGGTIHVMREQGLSISTEREGEFRHGRYTLLTAGVLLGGDHG